MICDRCKGSGVVPLFYVNNSGYSRYPCPVCGGCGIASCCEGATPCDEIVKEQADAAKTPSKR